MEQNKETIKLLEETNKRLDIIIKLIVSQSDKTKLCRHIKLNKKGRYYCTDTHSSGNYWLYPCVDCGVFVRVDAKEE